MFPATKKRELYSSLPDCQLNFFTFFETVNLKPNANSTNLFRLPHQQEGRILREEIHESNTKP